MIVTAKRIIFTSMHDLIKIKPVFDVHLGAKVCDVRAFKAFLLDSDKDTYFIFGGDLFDSIVVGDPRYRKSNDATEGDAIIDELVDMGEEILTPYKDKILGIATGNHEDVITKRCGSDPIRRLCRRLDVDPLGFSGLMRLMLSMKGKKGKTYEKTRKVVVRYHHGWGGGSRTQGADLTKFSKDVKHWDADLYLYGHVHRKQTDKIPRLGLSGEKLISKPKVICICGTFLKTYGVSADPTYSEIKGYPPTEIGGVVVTIKIKDNGVKISASTD